MLEFFQVISNATVVLSILLALAIILKFNTLSKPLQFVGIYLIVSSSLDLVSTALYSVAKSNLVFFHLFTFFEIVILSILFKLLFKALNSKINIYYIAIPTIFFVILNTLFIQNIREINTYSSILVSTIILGYCIYFFFLILDVKASNYQFTTLKWFVICIFIFHSISLVFMVFENLTTELSKGAQSYIWSFRSVVLLMTKIILIISFSKLFLKSSKLMVNE